MEKKPRERPSGPEDWRELLRTQYDYPEDLAPEGAGRKARRRAKKEWREADRESRRAYIRGVREREPASPGGVIVLIVALLVIGGVASWLFPKDSEDDAKAADHVQASPTAAVSGADSSSGTAGQPPASASPSAPAVDLSQPDEVSAAFIKAYLTRDPVKDQGPQASVERAEPWMTKSLRDNLAAHPDPAYKRLVIRGGVATVGKVEVAEAGDELPVDIPKVRAFREVRASIAVKEWETKTEVRTLHLELVYTTEGWLVARILDLV
ncbi:hypothetical protein QWM81_11360 [Streptomyces ficellus]|uniref:Uncharacterized protein n=1 Tax=Streptomyces ficellus TaxID=1977088 RepID=A0ABT7Z5T6_9ACTN|nr:hypothetical protein [Streptomyces ficellus]MDN3294642.1 hypothetical protein [Streptomyces ficellus]